MLHQAVNKPSIFKQGSGGNVTIANGKIKGCILDGGASPGSSL